VLLNLKSHLLGEGGGRRLLMHRRDKIVTLRQTAIFPAGQLQRILQWARGRTIPMPDGPHIVRQVFISQHADYNSRMGISPEKRVIVNWESRKPHMTITGVTERWEIAPSRSLPHSDSDNGAGMQD
jgi:hypothetical protein